MSVTVSSTAFVAGSPIPSEYTCDGANRSPDLSWTWVPTSTQSIAIVVDDPGAPSGAFTHWVVWDIKPETHVLPRGSLGGGVAGTNDFRHVGYDGPCPAQGQLHNYRFAVYGLDTLLVLEPAATRVELDRAMNGHVVAQGMLLGSFQRD